MCQDALEDGATAECDTLRLIAGCGTKGKHPQNIERDLLSRMRKHLKVGFKPFPVTVPAVDTATELTRENTAYAILPHEVFPSLYELERSHGTFHERFGRPENWEEFWLAHRFDDWMDEHPLRYYILANPRMCSPYREALSNRK